MKKEPDLQFDEFFSDSLRGGELGYRELPISQRIFLWIALFSLSVGLVIAGRIGFLSVVEAQFYAGRASANINQEIALPAYRGLITDRNGVVLAQNAETFSVIVDTGELLKERSRLHEVMSKVAEATLIPVSDLYAVLANADLEALASVPLIRNITTEAAIAIRSLELPAVHVENDYRREYPLGPAFSHVIGYTGVSEKGNAIIGKSGLEKYYDEALRGNDGVIVRHKDALGEFIDEKVVSEPVSGYHLQTSLDAEFQQQFFKIVTEGLRRLGLSRAVGIAMNPQNGEVLALLNVPSFDNNMFTTPGNNAGLTALFTDTLKPLFNRAVSGLYNPASTIKPLIAAAALKEKVVTPDFLINSKGYIEVPNPYFPDKPSRFVDWKAHGLVSLRSAIARSSNVYFYYLGGGFEGFKGLGIDRLKKYWQFFGLGERTGIDLDFESDGTLPDPDYKEEVMGQPWRLGDTYNVSIGQGDLIISPLQLLNYIASIANGGTRFQPSIMRRIEDSQEWAVSERQPVIVQAYQEWEEEFAEVRAGMRDTVAKDYGTAWILHDLPFSVSAKTGSAQTNNNTKTNALFVGYAPSENPSLAILILVEDTKDGSRITTPIAREIFEWYYYNRILDNTNLQINTDATNENE